LDKKFVGEKLLVLKPMDDLEGDMAALSLGGMWRQKGKKRRRGGRRERREKGERKEGERQVGRGREGKERRHTAWDKKFVGEKLLVLKPMDDLEEDGCSESGWYVGGEGGRREGKGKGREEGEEGEDGEGKRGRGGRRGRREGGRGRGLHFRNFDKGKKTRSTKKSLRVFHFRIF
jgi:hypothetical protein